MSQTLTRALLLMTLLTLASFAPAVAQTASFDAEVDCAGIYAPGDQVDYTIRLENQTLEQIPLDLTIDLFIPGRGDRTIREFTMTLRPNQDRMRTLRINLPLNSPASNNYEITFTASSATETSFDTCSFQVQ